MSERDEDGMTATQREVMRKEGLAVYEMLNSQTVQVPVSLIERIPHDEGCGVYTDTDYGPVFTSERLCDCWKHELTALLSQQTPTAERHHPACGALDEPCHCAERGDAEPPRIEDLAPGTRFIGQHIDPEECGGIDHAWFVLRPGARPLVISDEGQHWSGDSIDPSAIRDITPPTSKDPS